jgi:CheY-like chemotaxis protein
LLVEDDSVDAMTVERALSDLGVANPLVRTAGAAEALEYLRTESDTEPCMILLDLNMPGVDGFEFLNIVKADEALKNIPVVVATTSPAEADKTKSLRLGAAGHLVKAVDYGEFVKNIRATLLGWTTCEKTPKAG